MAILVIPHVSQATLVTAPETGMGFQIFRGAVRYTRNGTSETIEEIFLALNPEILLPYRLPSHLQKLFLTVSDLPTVASSGAFPTDQINVEGLHISAMSQPRIFMSGSMNHQQPPPPPSTALPAQRR